MKKYIFITIIILVVIQVNQTVFGYCESLRDSGCIDNVEITSVPGASCSETTTWVDENDSSCTGNIYDKNGEVVGFYSYESVWEGTQSGYMADSYLYTVTYSQDPSSCNKCNKNNTCATDQYGESNSSSGCVIDPYSPFTNIHFLRCES
jgi:hypothetical protein